MPRNRIRPLYTEERVRAMFAKMRDELHEMAAKHRREVESLRRELASVRSAFDELRSINLARANAENQIAELRRLREIGRARAAERDPAAPLQ